MRVIAGFERLDTDPLHRPVTVVIGNFDGCHLGHQQLMTKTRELADSLGTLTAALTFLPHPEIVFGNLATIDLLFPLEQKLQAFQEFGFDAVVIQPFDSPFAETPHDTFYQRDLKRRLKTKAIVVGDNFKFGYKRRGDALFLREACSRDNLQVFLSEHVLDDDSILSSTRIRGALRRGEVEAAAKALGRPYALFGTVVRGDQKGRTIGFPTLNLLPAEQLIPAHGVYAGWLQVGSDMGSTPLLKPPLSQMSPAVFNIGVRPTVNGTGMRIEGHALDRDLGETYGQDAIFLLAHRLRGEAKFSSLETLQKQIQLDVEAARRILA